MALNKLYSREFERSSTHWFFLIGGFVLLKRWRFIVVVLSVSDFLFRLLPCTTSLLMFFNNLLPFLGTVVGPTGSPRYAGVQSKDHSKDILFMLITISVIAPNIAAIYCTFGGILTEGNDGLVLGMWVSELAVSLLLNVIPSLLNMIMCVILTRKTVPCDTPVGVVLETPHRKKRYRWFDFVIILMASLCFYISICQSL